MDCHYLSVRKSWRLNERHYGKSHREPMPCPIAAALPHLIKFEWEFPLLTLASTGLHWLTGALTGLSKAEAAKRFGKDLVKKYRRDFYTRPPLMTPEHPFYSYIYRDGRYDTVPDGLLPYGESLAMCMERVRPYWEQAIAPSILAGRRVLVVSEFGRVPSLFRCRRLPSSLNRCAKYGTYGP